MAFRFNRWSFLFSQKLKSPSQSNFFFFFFTNFFRTQLGWIKNTLQGLRVKEKEKKRAEVMSLCSFYRANDLWSRCILLPWRWTDNVGTDAAQRPNYSGVSYKRDDPLCPSTGRHDEGHPTGCSNFLHWISYRNGV